MTAKIQKGLQLLMKNSFVDTFINKKMSTVVTKISTVVAKNSSVVIFNSSVVMKISTVFARMRVYL